jgi:hypothetical protein
MFEHEFRLCPASRRRSARPGGSALSIRKFQAECRRGSSRSITEAAPKRRHSRISSVWRSGYSARISLSDSPPANNRSTVATGIRRWRTHGTPPICAGSTVMRSKFFTPSTNHYRNNRQSRIDTVLNASELGGRPWPCNESMEGCRRVSDKYKSAAVTSLGTLPINLL